MTGQPSNPEPARTPGDRRLARPPSDRYRDLEPAEPPEPGGSFGNAVAFGAIAAAGSAAILTVLGGLAFSAGLVAIAGLLGWSIAQTVRTAGGSALDTAARRRLAVLFAVVAVLGGQLGIWLFALAEGGVMAPLDYLGETFGILVPVQFAAATVVAWLSAR